MASAVVPMDWSLVRDDVTAALEELGGAPLHVLRPSSVEVDPVTGLPGAGGAAQRLPAFGVIAAYAARDVDGTIIKRDDRQVVLQAAFEILDGDSLETKDGTVWRLQNVESVDPSGELNVCYVLQVRR